jgi:hypothetical protein
MKPMIMQRNTRELLGLGRPTRRGLLLAGAAAAASPPLVRADISAPPRLYPQVPLSNRLTQRVWNGAVSAYTNTGGTGQTIGMTTQLPSVPQWVRLMVFNDQTGAAWILSGAAIAPTSQIGSDPSLADDDTGSVNSALWQSLTFNNGGADVDPWNQTGGSAASLAIPANPNPDASQPLLLFSDWVQVPPPGTEPIGRIDGGQGFLVIVREYSSGNVRYAGQSPAVNSALNITAGNGAWGSGNLTTTGNYTGLGNSFSFNCPYGVQYISAVRGATVLAVGDSILASLCTTGSASGAAIWGAQQVTSPGLPVAFCNAAFSGRKNADFIPDGYRHVTLLKPQICVVQAWSQNDQTAGNTQATADNCFQRAAAFADFCLKQGCMPILCTAAPVYYGDSAGSAEEQYRVSNNVRVRAWGAAGGYVLDLDQIWGTGSNPVKYANASSWQCAIGGEQQHPTDAASQAAGQVLAPLISRILGLS